VAKLRNYVTTEVNRVFNKILELLKPGHLVLEQLDFRDCKLSRRMNRILSNCGRKAVKDKLVAIEQEKGVTHETVQPAYTSQTCPSPGCGYVDKRNRHGEKFRCHWCGFKRHADVVGARNIGGRRSSARRDLPRVPGNMTKANTLEALVSQHRERYPGSVGSSVDPRSDNPYFDTERLAKARSGVRSRSAESRKKVFAETRSVAVHFAPKSE
jgi:putative transposase